MHIKTGEIIIRERSNRTTYKLRKNVQPDNRNLLISTIICLKNSLWSEEFVSKEIMSGFDKIWGKVYLYELEPRISIDKRIKCQTKYFEDNKIYSSV